MPSRQPESVVWKSYTPRSLRQFDGTAGPAAPILFAIRGKVYDVSTGRSFYGPGGPYGRLIRNLSVRLAERES
jgi:membrane-associated progesterone receptor component